MNYYNEFDKNAAAWLRNLIARGLIAPGDVDDRSIEDVHPSDLAGYTQCHFFAGIGVWSYALRRAGWRDDEPVWTGSCPCQPFSAAGKGEGFADERHLWPAWFWLQQHAKPRGVPVLGEQVASKAGLAWLDVVQADLEGAGYTVRPADLCAAGVGAPHIRQRLFFVADDEAGRRSEVDAVARRGDEGDGAQGGKRSERSSRARQLADAGGTGQRPGDRAQSREPDEHRDDVAGRGRFGGLEDTERAAGARLGQHGWSRIRFEEAARLTGSGGTRGWWRRADWLYCADQKYRPVEPGTFPLAHGAPARVVRLRAYGNAIVAPLAEEFIRAYRDVRGLALT